MKDGRMSTSRRSTNDAAAIQVICLGSGGGPSEDNVTGFLVRSTSSNWAKGSLLAVDAGSHLAAIQRILERDFPIVSGGHHLKVQADPTNYTVNAVPTEQEPNDNLGTSDSESRSSTPEVSFTVLDRGPFAGLAFPHASARANAVHVVREHVSTYLITHPHLDHLAGFAINTAAFHNTSRPKRLAALPFTVNAIKTHIFNDIVWPNLTDEDNGVGFVTFQRLTEGGNLALGDGHSRGFIEVCDGLAVKGFKVSHGVCAGAPRADYTRRGSNANILDPGPTQHSHASSHNVLSHTHAQSHNGGSSSRVPSSATEARRASIFSQPSQPGTPTFYGGGQEYSQCVVDSTAFFIRAEDTGKEILIFGDVEPDSISSLPRTHIVWQEAAPKIAQGILSGIFIECSYNDSQKDSVLFGHLAPRHLVKELEALADLVAEKRRETPDKRRDATEKGSKKRKRYSSGVAPPHSAPGPGPGPGPGAAAIIADDAGPPPPQSRRSRVPISAPPHRSVSTPAAATVDEPMRDAALHAAAPNAAPAATDATSQLPQPALDLAGLAPAGATGSTGGGGVVVTAVPVPPYDGPLAGVRVIVIHVKDTMADGPLVGDSILRELWAHEARLASLGRALGCVFEVCAPGGSYWF